MCGRYTLANPDPARLRLRFDLDESLRIAELPRFNIAPTDPVLAVRSNPETGSRDLGSLRWGLLPSQWAVERKGPPLINARAETIDKQPAFREAFAERRCLIPADGFYEWRHDGQGKVPIWISRPDGDLFAFAGIWASYQPREGGEPTHSCAIITCAPNPMMSEIHDRMPVVLDPKGEPRWLDPGASWAELRSLLAPAPDSALVGRQVPDLVNNVREDGPALLGPRREPDSLFQV